MSEPLSAHQEPDVETLWRAMRSLLDRLFTVLDADTMLDDALDIVVDLLGADRGILLLRHDDGTLHAINARGHRKALSAAEREEISRTLVNEACETGRCVVWDVATAPASSESVTELGILAALAAPLPRCGSDGEGARGVLYVDFRDRRKFVGHRHVEFFLSAAAVLGAVMEQDRRGSRAREHLREARANLVEARRATPLDDLVGWPSMALVRRDVEAALHGSSPVLVLGESGTGKTLLAHAFAEASGRRPIVRAMLGASDDLNTITSELFGHERGAYSGAAGKRVGLVEFADGGTLIFDEILNLPLHAQRLLLDFTQFGTYRPLGHDRAEPKRATVRLIAATNGDLRAAIREGRFREDLYHRLAGFTIELPPLRDRREDIPPLAEKSLRRADPARAWTLSLPLRRLLVSTSIPWSGNVRQLERVIVRARDRAVARDPEATCLTPEHLDARDLDQAALPRSSSAPPDSPEVTWQRLQAERDRIDEREAGVLRDTLARHEGVIAHAARELGIARTTLSDRIRALGMRGSR
jgi:transcriptional regulator with GAF, ATPase, and Fis domain